MKRFITLLLFLLICLFPLPTFAEGEGDSVLDAYEKSSTERDADEPPTQEENDEPLNENIEAPTEPTEQETPLFTEGSNTISFWGLVFRFVMALALVVVLIYVLLKLVNKFNSKQGQLKNLENLGGISVGINKSVQIVKVGETVYLLGVGDNVELLTEIKDQQFINLMVEQQSAQSDLLSKVTQSITDQTKFKQQKKQTQSSNDNLNASNDSFSKLFKGELEQMKQKQAKIREDIKGHD